MSFYLQKFLDFLPSEVVIKIANFRNYELLKISANSNNIADDFGFIAVKGVKFNGETCIDEVIKKGAKVVWAECDCRDFSEKYPSICFVQVANSRLVNAFSCQFEYWENIEKLDLLAVSGTNGKTTTAYLFYQILSELNQKCGLISTVKYFDGKNFSDSIQTTPAAETLFPLLNSCVLNGCKYVPMEVSSHSLAQYRLGKLKFKTAIFTNLTGDHLDFHGDMESYYQVKKQLYLNHTEAAVINIGDSYGKRLADELRKESKVKIITFADGSLRNDADYILNINLKENSSDFLLNGISFKTNLLGNYNVLNLSGVLISLMELGYSSEKLAAIVGSLFFNVPGRLELIKLKNGAKVFIDYAHTDDALNNVLSNLKKIPHKKIITVFGCGGDRDKTKRSRMGKVATELSDYTIITSDNPRSEKPSEIIKDIQKGVAAAADFEILENRADAIRKSLTISENGDIVLIAGKGHENTQEISGEKLYFSDSEIVIKFNGEK